MAPNPLAGAARAYETRPAHNFDAPQVSAQVPPKLQLAIGALETNMQELDKTITALRNALLPVLPADHELMSPAGTPADPNLGLLTARVHRMDCMAIELRSVLEQLINNLEV